MLHWIWHLPGNVTVELARLLGPRKTLRFGPPVGLYSEYDAVVQGRVPGRVIHEKQASPALAAQSLREVCGLRQTQFQPWPFFWSQRQDARLVGPSLAMMDGAKRLCAEAVFYDHELHREPSYRHLWLPPAVRLSGNWTSVVSSWGYGFHHWWMDVLPRLSVLDEFPPDTGIIVFPKLESYQAQSLKLLGIEARVRPTPEQHLLVENYYFASPTAMTGCWNPYAVHWLRRRFLPHAALDWEPPRRFYIRRIARHRGIANEAEVIQFFEQRGWTILDLENMPVPRQIRLFAEAEAICGLHGAAFTNLLWSRPGCQAMEICARGYLNGVYEGMAECVGVKHHHLICKADGAFQAEVNMPELRKVVEEMERGA